MYMYTFNLTRTQRSCITIQNSLLQTFDKHREYHSNKLIYKMYLKGIACPKVRISWTCTHPQTKQDVDEVVSSLDQIWEIYHCITCSPMDHLQWMGAVRIRVQTADKHHNNPRLHSIYYCLMKWKAACLQDIFNHYFWPKIWVHNP